MDRRLTSRFLFLILSLLSSACAQQKTVETIFPKPVDSCQGQAIANQYVVRWASGHVTLLKNSKSRDEIIKEFVEPNMKELDRVEPNVEISLKDATLPRSAGSFPTAVPVSIDNWGPERIRADQAWKLNYRGGGITVAVIDSGLDESHLQLADRLAININEIPNNGIDDDQNGFVDDSAGFDFTVDSPNMQDLNSHGTHVSGIIAASHNDVVAGPSDHVQGVAPEAKILPLTFIDSTGVGSLFNAMRAIDYASERGAQVMNASWGGSACSTILRDQITGLYAKGQIFVAAAGNSGLDIDSLPEYPAAFNLLPQFTIGAIGTFDSRAGFSNYGDRGVHIFAPGVDIVSTVPGGFAAMSGTSMATPLAAGALAVLRGAKPLATIDELRVALYQSAVRDPSYRNASHGRLDLAAALDLLLK